MANRHIQHLRSGDILATKQAAINKLQATANTNDPMNLAKDGEIILARYGQVWSWDSSNEKWVILPEYAAGTYEVLHSMPTDETIATWNTNNNYLLVRTVEGVVRVSSDGTQRSVSIVADHDDVSNVLDALDYTDTMNTNTVVIAANQTNGQISTTHATLGTDGSILIESDYSGNDKTITAKVVIDETERVLTTIGATTASASRTAGVSNTNDPAYITSGNAPLTIETVKTGTIYTVDGDPATYYRWDGNGWHTETEVDKHRLFTGINFIKLSDATVSKMDDPNVKDAYMMVDKNGNQLGDIVKIYKDSSLYTVYAGTEADTLTNMSLWTKISGSAATPVYTEFFALNADKNNITVYDTVTDNVYSNPIATDAVFDHATNILSWNDGANQYLFTGYATPWIVKKVIKDAEIKSGEVALSKDWLDGFPQTSGTADPTIYRITTPNTDYTNKYYSWDGTTYVPVTGDATKKSMNFVYELAGLEPEHVGEYTMVKFPLEDYLTNYIFGRGLIYNPSTKVLEVNPGYGLTFDATTGKLVLEDYVKAGLTYYGTAAAAAVGSNTNIAVTLSNTNANFELIKGANIIVTFLGNSTAAGEIAMHVNSTDEKTLKYNGQNLTSDYINENSTLHFVYDGTNYNLVGMGSNGGSMYDGVTNTNTSAHTNTGDFVLYGDDVIDIQDDYVNVQINSSAAPFSSTWFTGVTPAANIKYRIITEGNYYGRTYEWDATNSKYKITTSVTQDLAIKVANTMVDGSNNHVTGLDNLITITSNGLTMKDTWDCETY